MKHFFQGMILKWLVPKSNLVMVLIVTSISFQLFLSNTLVLAQGEANFFSTPLEGTEDLSNEMVKGIDRFLTDEADNILSSRGALWQLDYSSLESYNLSIEKKRLLLAKILGVVDKRTTPFMELLNESNLEPYFLDTKTCIIRPVRWKVLEGPNGGMNAEGLLLQPKDSVIARAVMILDADVLPEVLAGFHGHGQPGFGTARRLAEAGWEILVPVLLSREDTFSGNREIGPFTNQPHKEWIYIQGFEVGRHVIGYELQKVFSAIDWLEAQNRGGNYPIPIGVVGHGEGGMLALYAAALDRRIKSSLVCGYFDSRERMWIEPIYRNVFGLLKNFGDAELAVMAWPRKLVMEHGFFPERPGTPTPSQGRSGAAPGSIEKPDLSSVRGEWERAVHFLPVGHNHLGWHDGTENGALKVFPTPTITEFVEGMEIGYPSQYDQPTPILGPTRWPDPIQRQGSMVKEMERHVQCVLDRCEFAREKFFLERLKGDTLDQKLIKDILRNRLWEVIGRVPTPSTPINTRARLLKETAKWKRYEVVLDVFPGVFAWGILTIPKDSERNTTTPVVVCQHGLEGLPMDVVRTDPDTKKFSTYNGFATQLAERGYVTFAPHNPYRGGDQFRILQRKANPLGISLFSIITAQHQRILEWLAQKSFVDSERIGFYGLSYGGKTAMRVPALVEGYALSICSGDFYEWVRVNSLTDQSYSYMYTGEYEMPEWDLGHKLNYAEMPALIAHRPFMVERGHFDNLKTDPWVNYEYAKVRRHYDFIVLSERTQLDYFMGSHRINGEGTFDFLDRYLKHS
ncbi:alpha/beta hydrolase family protein [Lunatibacter salilacus]|uniref:alpha/beta hydrolase family protein n=1 Tax=Lunatibacter salilacus TaxID=2483804 RepID=UPI00131BCA2D|nr:prolyl oligopeptidase family serine peptidase [Lunatibacter salilacus]